MVQLLLFVWVLIAPAWADGPPPPDCSNPRRAADSLFDWLKPASYDPTKAKTCLDLPADANGERIAVQLKQLLDARGLLVPTSSLSTDPRYVDEAGRAVVVPLPDDLPVLTIERGADGRWRYGRDVVEAVPELYASTFSPLSVWFQAKLPPAFYARFLGLHLWQWLYAGILLGGAWIVGQTVRVLLRGQVRRLVRRAGLRLDDDAYAQTNAPIVALVVFGAMYWGLPDLQLPIAFSAPVHRVVRIAMWLCALAALYRFIDVGAATARSWAERTHSKLDDQLIPLLRQAARILLLVAGGLTLVDELGFDVWKLAAGVGIGGLAFALAAQDTVANVFGSVNIFVDKPFQIGDWVKIGDVEGVVEEVGFRSTRVRTFYNSVVTIPNSRITNANVDNLGLRPRRRCKFTVGLTYDTPPEKLQAYVEGVRAILAAHPHVERSYEVHVHDLGASAIEILVYYHVVVPGWHEELVTRSQNLLELVRLANDLGVSFAFPSTSVYVEATPERPLPPRPAGTADELDAIVAAYGPGGTAARPEGPALRSWSVQARADADHGSTTDAG